MLDSISRFVLFLGPYADANNEVHVTDKGAALMDHAIRCIVKSIVLLFISLSLSFSSVFPQTALSSAGHPCHCRG